MVKLILISLQAIIAINAVLSTNVPAGNGFQYIGSFRSRLSVQGRSTQLFDESNYYISQNWGACNTAQKDCESLLNANLLAVETEEEWKHVRELLKNYGFATSYWTSGEYARTEWRWSANDIALAPFAPWQNGHPKNANALLSVLINYRNRYDATWSTVPNTQLHRYICEEKVQDPLASSHAPPSAPPSTTPSAPPSTTSSAPPLTTPSAPPLTTPSAPPLTTPSAPPSTTPSAPPSTTPSAPPSTTPSAPPSTTPSAPPSTTPSAPPLTTPSAPPSAFDTHLCYQTNDLVIVLDSGSIGRDNFQKSKQFVEQLVSAFTVYSPNRVSFVTYSYYASTHIDLQLSSSLSPAEISSKILTTEYEVDINTNTNWGIELATKQLLSYYRGVPMNMVIFAGFESYSHYGTANMAKKAIDSGIRIYSVGITPHINQHELLEMAGNDASQVFTTENFDSLINLLGPLSLKICSP